MPTLGNGMGTVTGDEGKLYALAMAVMPGPERNAVASHFLRVLVDGLHLVGASIWWPPVEEGEAKAVLSPLAAIPEPALTPAPVSSSHPLWLLGRRSDAAVIDTRIAAHAPLKAAANVPSDHCMLFPLGAAGVLKLELSSAADIPLSLRQQLPAILERLAAALEAAEQLEHTSTTLSDIAVSEKRLLDILDNVDACIYLKDAQGHYLFANRPVLDLWQVSLEQVIGSSDEKFFDAATAENIRRNDLRVLVHGETLRAEEVNTVPALGETRVFQTTKIPLRSNAGHIYALCGISSDITSRKAAEAALATSEEQLRSLIEAIPDSIQFKDGDGRWLVANTICLRLFGLEGAVWRGFTDRELGLIHPHLAAGLASCKATDDEAWEHGRLFRTEEIVPDGHGGVLHFDVIKVPLFDQEYRRQALVIVGRDVTERRRMDEELAKHRNHLENLVRQRTAELSETEAHASHILNSSADGLYGVDSKGIITFINPAACQILGYTPEQAIGHSAHALFHHSRPDGSAYPQEACPSQMALLSGNNVRIDDEVYWHVDGHPVPVMYAVHPTRQGDRISGAVVSFVDITAQRTAAEAQERALVAAENLARVRSEFLANMSHEIRTPLNGVIGFAQIGLRSAEDTEKTREAFSKILVSGSRLLAVVNDVLDFSRIEAGKLPIDPVNMDLREVVNHALDLIRDRAVAKGLALHTELADNLPKLCVGDPMRIGQVLINLLSNAVKFTEVGSIRLTVALKNDRIVFRVIDSGIGIREGELGRLFNPFQQADNSTTRRFGGTGLGLAISKQILSLMGGVIHARSEPGAGSVFEFSLPFVPATGLPLAVETENSQASLKPLAGLKILAAEDDQINQLVLEENLVDFGAQVTLVENGRQAVDAVMTSGSNGFDVVLMDIQMPEMDGYEATRRINALAPGLPVIGQTAHALAEERDKCLAAGMVAHIAKPLDPDEMVRKILQHKRRPL